MTTARVDNPPVRAPQELFTNLVDELRGIEAKETTDARWFELGEDDRLTLRARPLDFLSLIWEFLERIFTSKLVRLEQKFESISDQVEEYLNAETDERRLGEFLNRFTIPMNELYRCAGRMQQAQRISENALAHLQTKARICDYMIAEIDPHRRVELRGREYNPYLRSVVFAVENTIPNYSVVFNCSEGHRLQDFLRDRVVRKERVSQCFSADDRLIEIFAEVTSQRRLALPRDLSHTITLDSNLVASEISQKIVQGTVRELKFQNLNDKTMRIKIHGWESGVGEFSLGVMEKRNITLPNDFPADKMDYSITYQTAPKSLFFGCKIARYTMGVNQRGDLDSEIVPMHVRDRTQPREYSLIPQQRIEIKNTFGNDILARFSLSHAHHSWNVFIPKGITFNYTREQVSTTFVPAHLRPENEGPLRLNIFLLHLERILRPVACAPRTTK